LAGSGSIGRRAASNAFIPELAGDPELRTWLDSVGPSVAEASRIQPTYDPPAERGVSASYALTSILVSGSSLTTLGFNAIAPSRASAWAGVIAGTAGLIAGAVKLDEAGATDDVASANVIAGAGALIFGLYRLSTPRPSSPNVSISPVVIPTDRSPRIGFAVHTTFR
jgi:hypothetical protein